MLKMSLLEENAGVKTDSGDLERAETQCNSEGPGCGPLEPGPSLTSLSSAHTDTKVITQVPEKFIIRDPVHKVLVLNSGTLLAVPDRNYIRPAIFFTLPARFSFADEHEGNPIFLAVLEEESKAHQESQELCLCCEMDSESNQPTLQLKKQSLVELITWQEGDSKPFTFYRTEVLSRNELESAAYSGWFICTSDNLCEPVGMTDIIGQEKYTDFSFELVKYDEVSLSEIRE